MARGNSHAIFTKDGVRDCHVPLSCKISALGSRYASNIRAQEETNATQLSRLHTSYKHTLRA